MKKVSQSFLVALAAATDRELARQVQYLKVENRILRASCPSGSKSRRANVNDYSSTVFRPHQSLGNVPISRTPPDIGDGPIAYEGRLGGLLKHYYRRAE